jgi:hypothetical protein
VSTDSSILLLIKAVENFNYGYVVDESERRLFCSKIIDIDEENIWAESISTLRHSTVECHPARFRVINLSSRVGDDQLRMHPSDNKRLYTN